jgi:hypothetical protein
MLKHNLNRTHENICVFDLPNKRWYLRCINGNVCFLIYDHLIFIESYLLVPNVSNFAPCVDLNLVAQLEDLFSPLHVVGSTAL